MALGWREQYLRYREFYLNIQALYKQRADLRAFLEIILSLSTVIIFLLFALKPTAVTIISLFNQIQEKQKTIVTLDQKITNLDTANNLLVQYQDSLTNIDSAVGTLARPDLFVGQVQALGTKDTVNIQQISTGEFSLIGPPPPTVGASQLTALPDNAKEIDVAASAEGPYPNLASFVKDFNNLRMIVKVDSIGISITTAQKGKQITTVVTGRVPFIGQ